MTVPPRLTGLPDSTVHRYTAWGNKISASTYKDWPTNTKKITEYYQYNLYGNVTGYTDPNQKLNDDGVTTSYAYDALGRLNTVKDALNLNNQI
ncbi:RHS repeat domain-containing protein [Paenibacillus sp. DMB5]|uniref:RHS repeat domain-containing protein n=1 Tax=Paenibacillus sp. DMB5 TaxID=1780103 RepID=UPI000AFDCFD3|nr:RHS repeat domain-containing protein [Paenibacillus sp. DMB5]